MLFKVYPDNYNYIEVIASFCLLLMGKCIMESSMQFVSGKVGIVFLKAIHLFGKILYVV